MLGDADGWMEAFELLHGGFCICAAFADADESDLRRTISL